MKWCCFFIEYNQLCPFALSTQFHVAGFPRMVIPQSFAVNTEISGHQQIVSAGFWVFNQVFKQNLVLKLPILAGVRAVG
jgi:hypothetical protein